ncbi:MAG: ATP-binding cassette domain-containing protein [Lachnospiraceae bacterium]|nr:ATP-binding cassette domain-containing protein [Lachnospiraceae bacterium]
MFKKVAPYIGRYKKYTVWAAILMSFGIVANVMPYFFLYQIISPLTKGEHIDLKFVMIRVAAVFLCEIVFAIAYVQGLTFSHISAYNTLKNLRVSLQGKLEKQPLGNIQSLGTGRIKKVFTDDIDQIELLLAHAIPEGIANIFIPVLIVVIMFVLNWKLALLALVPLVIGMLAMGMMMKSGFAKMNDYYESAAKMNNTIVEYVNGMEVVKVFNKDGDSYKRFGEVVRNYRDFTIAWYKVCWPWMAAYSSIIPCLALLMLPVGSAMVLDGTVTLDKLILVICMSFSVGPSLLKALNFAGKFPQLNYKISELEKLMEHPPLKEGTSGFKGSDRSISFENVHFGYGDEEVLHGVNLEMKHGTVTALVGESGSGKSTLARLILGIHSPLDGKVFYDGLDITKRRLNRRDKKRLSREIQFISQDFGAAMDPKMTVRDIIAEPLDIHRLFGTKKETDQHIKKILSKVHLDENVLDRRPSELSGGQKQRVNIARAYAMVPKLLVADEALSSLDVSIQAQIVDVLSELRKERETAMLFIAHDLSMVEFISDRVGVMYKGHLVELAPTKELFSNPVHSYTRTLLLAAPKPDPVIEKKRTIGQYKRSSSEFTHSDWIEVSEGHFVLREDAANES